MGDRKRCNFHRAARIQYLWFYVEYCTSCYNAGDPQCWHQDCGVGKFVAQTDAGTADTKTANQCTTCGAGKTNNGAKSACEACAAGKFAKNDVDTDAAKGRQDCAVGKFVKVVDGATKAACDKCPAGKTSEASQVDCAACAAGKFAKNDVDTQALLGCRDCAAGKYAAVTNGAKLETCLDCGAGKTHNDAPHPSEEPTSSSQPCACASSGHSLMGLRTLGRQWVWKIWQQCAPGRARSSATCSALFCGTKSALLSACSPSARAQQLSPLLLRAACHARGVRSDGRNPVPR